MNRRAAYGTIYAFTQRVSNTLLGKKVREIPGARSLYRFLARRSRPSHVTVRGHTIYLDPLDSLKLYANASYEQYELDLFRRCLRPGHTVLDVGAHIGLYTLEAARAVGDTGTVYAFEPSASNHALLVENIGVNRYRNVVPLKAAVSDRSGRGQLTLSPSNTGDHSLLTEATGDREAEATKTVTIDEFMEGRSGVVNIIKLDIQGAEPLAIAGARRTIEDTSQLLIFTEFSPMHLAPWGGARRYLTELVDAGFELFNLDELTGRVQATNCDRLARLFEEAERGSYTNLVCVKGKQALHIFEAAVRSGGETVA